MCVEVARYFFPRVSRTKVSVMYVYPKLRQARKIAAKYGVEVFSSDVGNKKLYVIYRGARIHFGDRRYEDFLMHRDLERRRNYRMRSGKKTDKTKPGFWARYILW